MSFLVNGNQYFSKVRNIASADIQTLNADQILVNKLRVAITDVDPSTTPGNGGDIVFYNDGASLSMFMYDQSLGWVSAPFT